MICDHLACDRKLSDKKPNMLKLNLILSCIILSLLIQFPAFAQTANDRAGDIKLWRQQCNDSDPDLRTAYIEEAIETKGVTIKRICIRQALESTDDDVRNLGLRAAIAMINELTFKVEMSEGLQQALKDAENDDEKYAAVQKSYPMLIYNSIKNGITFQIDNASISDGRSVWLPYGKLSATSEKYSGITTVIGDELAWAGSANVGYGNGYKCQLAATLGNEPQLEGTLQCGDWIFPVAAKLL